MTTRHNGKLLPYDDSFNLPIDNMVVKGQFCLPGTTNYDVRVYTDVKTGHNTQSPDPMIEHPTVYWNIGHAIAHGNHYESTSMNSAHLARMPFGHTEIYQLDNVYEVLDNTNWSLTMPNHSMVVPVFYPYDGRPPKAVTCYIVPNPTGKNLG